MKRIIFVLLIATVTLSFKQYEDNGDMSSHEPYTALLKEPSDPVLKSVWKQWKELKTPTLQFQNEFTEGWRFKQGNASEGLRVTGLPSIKGSQEVTLAHRINQPDSPLWYFNEITISQPGILSIHADDGAQLFINSKQVQRLDGIHFPIDSTGTFTVTMRVMNNAMEGGLNKVLFSTRKQFGDYKRLKALNTRLTVLAEKVLLTHNVSKSIVRNVHEAILTRDETVMELAEQQLKSYPLLFPYLFYGNERELSIHVLSDGKDPVILKWLKNGKELRSFSANGPVAKFKNIKIPAGDPKFQYQLSCNKTMSPVHEVKLHRPDAAWMFNVWADSQGGWETFQRHMSNASLYDDSFGIGVGDLVSNGSDSLQWASFIKILSASASEKPYYLIPGNHDYDGYYDDLHPFWYRKFTAYSPANYFTWTFKNAAFIALDPNEDFPIGIKTRSDQYTWFQKQINSEAWKKAKWRFVLMHQPPYSQGWAGYHGDKVIRDLLEPVMESARIDFVISGHTHDYERFTKQYGSQKTTFLIVGGAGGSLEPPDSSPEPVMDTVLKVHHMGRFTINDKQVIFRAIDSNNVIIDSLRVKK